VKLSFWRAQERKKRLARKDAKPQRNKGLSPEDAKPACGSQGAKKNPFASWLLCEKKKNPPRRTRNAAGHVAKESKNDGAQRREGAKKKNSLRLCDFAQKKIKCL
jgi:hypothetical protein